MLAFTLKGRGLTRAWSSQVPVMDWRSDKSESDAGGMKQERKPVGKATLASVERKNVTFAKWKKDQFRKERKIIFKLWRVPQNEEKEKELKAISDDIQPHSDPDFVLRSLTM